MSQIFNSFNIYKLKSVGLFDIMSLMRIIIIKITITFFIMIHNIKNKNKII